MGRLIDQLCEATCEWVQETGDSESIIAFHIMVRTGGTSSQHTIAQMKLWLETLVNEHYMFEDFLVGAVIQDVERYFEELSNREPGPKEKLESILADPQLTEKWVNGMNAIKSDPKFREKYSIPDSDRTPVTTATLEELRQSAERLSKPSVERQSKVRMFLDTWRKVTQPILEPSNLKIDFSPL